MVAGADRGGNTFEAPGSFEGRPLPARDKRLGCSLASFGDRERAAPGGSGSALGSFVAIASLGLV